MDYTTRQRVAHVLLTAAAKLEGADTKEQALSDYQKDFLEATQPHPFDRSSIYNGHNVVDLRPFDGKIHLSWIQTLKPKSGADWAYVMGIFRHMKHQSGSEPVRGAVYEARHPDGSASVVAKLYHATPMKNYENIMKTGIKASKASYVEHDTDVVFLSDEKGVSKNYAESGFGLDYYEHDMPWILFEIEGTSLDESRFEADRGQEAQTGAEEIEALGFSLEDAPYWAIMSITGQVAYAGDIPASAITPIEVYYPKQKRWQTFDRGLPVPLS